MAGKPGEDNGVSGLPEDWGHIVIPDDVSELDDLVAEVRREFRYDERLARRQRRLPFIVLAVTVIITLASLFTVPWMAGAGRTPSPSTPPTHSSAIDPSTEPSESDGCTGGACEMRSTPRESAGR